MRVATTQIFRQGINSILDQQASLTATQKQLSTGQRIVTPSDDPAGAVRALDLSQGISRAQQLNENSERAESRLQLEETTLSGVTNLLQRVRQLTVQANNSSLMDADRKAIATEVRELRAQLVGYANTQDANGEYLFAGSRTDTRPFTAPDIAPPNPPLGNVSYQGDGVQRQVQIGAQRRVTTNDPGDAVFVDIADGSGGTQSLFETLDNIADSLEQPVNNASDRAQLHSDLSNALGNIDRGLSNVSEVRAKVGGRLNAIDDQRGLNEAAILDFETTKSEVEDLDFAKAISQFQMERTALEAAQQSFLKVQGLSLFNYL